MTGKEMSIINKTQLFISCATFLTMNDSGAEETFRRSLRAEKATSERATSEQQAIEKSDKRESEASERASERATSDGHTSK